MRRGLLLGILSVAAAYRLPAAASWPPRVAPPRTRIVAAATDPPPPEPTVDDDELFAQAVAAAQAAKAARDAEAPAFMEAFVETASAAPPSGPETTAERAAAEALEAKQQALQRARQSMAPPPTGPMSFMQELMEGPKNIRAAAMETLNEAMDKQAREAAEEARARKQRPKGDLKKLYRQLNDAIERDDFDKAAQIKKTIEGVKGY